MTVHADSLTLSDEAGNLLVARPLSAGGDVLLDVAANDGRALQLDLRREDALALAEWIVERFGGAA